VERGNNKGTQTVNKFHIHSRTKGEGGNKNPEISSRLKNAISFLIRKDEFKMFFYSFGLLFKKIIIVFFWKDISQDF
jgi:hypothetical protein